MNGARPAELRSRLEPLVNLLYPGRRDLVDALLALQARWKAKISPSEHPHPDERTAYLIAYGDSFCRRGHTPLSTLAHMLDEHVGDAISDVHLLPVYPWTSDDGFAVVDHRRIDPKLGTWHDISRLANGRGIALDFVANHVSTSNRWFRSWLARDPRYDGFFLEPGAAFDTSHVTRPRTTPLTHTFVRPDHTYAHAWTTFGPDQADVDPSTPAVLLELTDVLLGYIARGASTIRLDAIGYLWKQSGTRCINLPQTHAIVKIWRTIIDHTAPGVRLLTETNVPEAENVEYFGNGGDEANLVYQFALPPLVLHAFATGSGRTLSNWAEGIHRVSDGATWFNFLASHDGIGLRPTAGILDDDDRQLLVERTLACGGRVSLARGHDGGQEVYELNTNYLDAVADPTDSDHDRAATDAGLAAHSILLSLVGVPAIYYHCLFGSGQNHTGAGHANNARRINRGTLDADQIDEQLRTPGRRSRMLDGITAMLRTRQSLRGLSPTSEQEVLHLDDRLVAIRRAPGTQDEITAVTNTSHDTVHSIPIAGTDMLTGDTHQRWTLPPHGYAWIRGSR